MTGSLRAAIVQHADTKTVLMLGWMDSEAERLTSETGLVHFWSRSRRRIWKKGETSGNVLSVVSMTEDCDGDALLVRVLPTGPTCHTGTDTCWGDDTDAGFGRLDQLWKVIERRAEERPDGSYTVALLEGGPDLPARKVVEEATEVLMAVKDHHAGVADDDRVADEVADLLFHLLVTIRERRIGVATVLDRLAARRSAQ